MLLQLQPKSHFFWVLSSMDPSNSRVKKPEVTVFGIWLEAVNWFCCHCLFYAHLKSFFSIQSKWLLCNDCYVSITWMFITITYDQNTFLAILFRTVGASAVSDDPLFTFSLWMWGSFFFFLLNTNSSCKTVPGIRLERSSSWGDRQALISVACPDGVEGDRRQIAEVSPKT